MTSVTISLPESLKAFVNMQLATGSYGNVSEYFRTLLREAQQKEQDAKLEMLLLAGLASGDAGSVTPKFWRELKAEAAEISARHQAKKRKKAV
jgi:antitoxin ParD1/3/4